MNKFIITAALAAFLTASAFGQASYINTVNDPATGQTVVGGNIVPGQRLVLTGTGIDAGAQVCFGYGTCDINAQIESYSGNMTLATIYFFVPAISPQYTRVNVFDRGQHNSGALLPVMIVQSAPVVRRWLNPQPCNVPTAWVYGHNPLFHISGGGYVDPDINLYSIGTTGTYNPNNPSICGYPGFPDPTPTYHLVYQFSGVESLAGPTNINVASTLYSSATLTFTNTVTQAVITTTSVAPPTWNSRNNYTYWTYLVDYWVVEFAAQYPAGVYNVTITFNPAPGSGVNPVTVNAPQYGAY